MEAENVVEELRRRLKEENEQYYKYNFPGGFHNEGNI
jgi:hypothetical protein